MEQKQLNNPSTNSLNDNIVKTEKEEHVHSSPSPKKKFRNTVFAQKMRNRNQQEKLQALEKNDSTTTCKSLSVDIERLSSHVYPKIITSDRKMRRKRKSQWSQGISNSRKKRLSKDFDKNGSSNHSSNVKSKLNGQQRESDISSENSFSTTESKDSKGSVLLESRKNVSTDNHTDELISEDKFSVCRRTEPFTGKLNTLELRKKNTERFLAENSPSWSESSTSTENGNGKDIKQDALDSNRLEKKEKPSSGRTLRSSSEVCNKVTDGTVIGINKNKEDNNQKITNNMQNVGKPVALNSKLKEEVIIKNEVTTVPENKAEEHSVTQLPLSDSNQSTDSLVQSKNKKIAKNCTVSNKIEKQARQGTSAINEPVKTKDIETNKGPKNGLKFKKNSENAILNQDGESKINEKSVNMAVPNQDQSTKNNSTNKDQCSSKSKEDINSDEFEICRRVLVYQRHVKSATSNTPIESVTPEKSVISKTPSKPIKPVIPATSGISVTSAISTEPASASQGSEYCRRALPFLRPFNSAPEDDMTISKEDEEANNECPPINTDLNISSSSTCLPPNDLFVDTSENSLDDKFSKKRKITSEDEAKEVNSLIKKKRPESSPLKPNRSRKASFSSSNHTICSFFGNSCCSQIENHDHEDTSKRENLRGCQISLPKLEKMNDIIVVKYFMKKASEDVSSNENNILKTEDCNDMEDNCSSISEQNQNDGMDSECISNNVIDSDSSDSIIPRSRFRSTNGDSSEKLRRRRKPIKFNRLDSSSEDESDTSKLSFSRPARSKACEARKKIHTVFENEDDIDKEIEKFSEKMVATQKSIGSYLRSFSTIPFERKNEDKQTRSQSQGPKNDNIPDAQITSQNSVGNENNLERECTTQHGVREIQDLTNTSSSVDKEADEMLDHTEVLSHRRQFEAPRCKSANICSDQTPINPIFYTPRRNRVKSISLQPQIDEIFRTKHPLEFDKQYNKLRVQLIRLETICDITTRTFSASAIEYMTAAYIEKHLKNKIINYHRPPLETEMSGANVPSTSTNEIIDMINMNTSNGNSLLIDGERLGIQESENSLRIPSTPCNNKVEIFAKSNTHTENENSIESRNNITNPSVGGVNSSNGISSKPKSKEVMYRCEKCTKVYITIKALIHHRSKEHSIKCGTLRCTICFQLVPSKEILTQHIATHSIEDLRAAINKKKLSDASNNNVGNVNQLTNGNQDPVQNISEEVTVTSSNKDAVILSESVGVHNIPSNNDQSAIENNSTQTVNNFEVTVCSCHAHETSNLTSQDLQIEMDLQCKTCNVIFRRSDCYEVHYRANPECRKLRFDISKKSTIMLCSSCPYILRSLQDMRTHLEMHANRKSDGTVTFLCNICKVAFFGVGSIFYNHWFQHAKDVNFVASKHSFPSVSIVSVIEDSPAPISSSRSDEGFFYIAEHVCKTCRTPFGSDSDLANHKKHPCATPEMKPKRKVFKIICKTCSKYYHGKEYFDRHIQDHNHLQTPAIKYSNLSTNPQIKKVLCNCCDTVTKDVKDMQIHWRKIHSLSREVYTCRICNEHPTGDPNLYTYERLENHYKIKHKEEEVICCLVQFVPATYICQICNIAFANIKTHQDHLITHETTSRDSNESSIPETRVVPQTRLVLSDDVQPDGGRQIISLPDTIKAPLNNLIVGNTLPPTHQVFKSTLPVPNSQPSLSNPMNRLGNSEIETIDLVGSRSNSPILDSNSVSFSEPICQIDNGKKDKIEIVETSQNEVTVSITSNSNSNPQEPPCISSSSAPILLSRPTEVEVPQIQLSSSEETSVESSPVPFEVVLCPEDPSISNTASQAKQAEIVDNSILDNTINNTKECNSNSGISEKQSEAIVAKNSNSENPLSAKPFLRVRTLEEIQELAMKKCKQCHFRCEKDEELHSHIQTYHQAVWPQSSNLGISNPVEILNTMTEQVNQYSNQGAVLPSVANQCIDWCQPENSIGSQSESNVAPPYQKIYGNVNTQQRFNSVPYNQQHPALPHPAPLLQREQLFLKRAAQNSQLQSNAMNNISSIPKSINMNGVSKTNAMNNAPIVYRGARPGTSIQLPERNNSSSNNNGSLSKRPSGAAARFPQNTSWQSSLVSQTSNLVLHNTYGNNRNNTSRQQMFNKTVPVHYQPQNVTPQQVTNTNTLNLYSGEIHNYRATGNNSNSKAHQRILYSCKMCTTFRSENPGMVKQHEITHHQTNSQQTSAQPSLQTMSYNNVPQRSTQSHFIKHVPVSQMPQRSRRVVPNTRPNSHLGDSEALFQCRLCSIRFPSNHEVMEHLETAHRQQSPQQHEEYYYICDFCEPQIFCESEESLRHHVSIMHQRKCNFCSESFANPDDLEEHTATSHKM